MMLQKKKEIFICNFFLPFPASEHNFICYSNLFFLIQEKKKKSS